MRYSSAEEKLRILALCGIVDNVREKITAYSSQYNRTYVSLRDSSSVYDENLIHRLKLLIDSLEYAYRIISILSTNLCRDEPLWAEVIRAYHILDKEYNMIVGVDPNKPLPAKIREGLYEVYSGLRSIVESSA